MDHSLDLSEGGLAYRWSKLTWKLVDVYDYIGINRLALDLWSQSISHSLVLEIDARLHQHSREGLSDSKEEVIHNYYLCGSSCIRDTLSWRYYWLHIPNCDTSKKSRLLNVLDFNFCKKIIYSYPYVYVKVCRIYCSNLYQLHNFLLK